MTKYIDAIDVDELIRRTAELEAVALEQVEKYEPSKDPVLWNRWTAILSERTAFKYDLIDAPIVDAIEVVRCDECRWCKVDGGFRHCMMSAIVHPTAEDYCSLGERKDAKTN